MQTVSKLTLALALLAWPFVAGATFVFSNVQIGDRAVSFKIDGDMSGYAAPTTNLHQFSLVYKGSLWIGPSDDYVPNAWSQSVFDNKTCLGGNTGGFGLPFNYSVVDCSGDLTDAAASSRLVTLYLTESWLNPDASGPLAFVWGNGNSSADHTVLQEVSQWTVNRELPEPSTSTLLVTALLGLVVMRGCMLLSAGRLDGAAREHARRGHEDALNTDATNAPCRLAWR